MNDAQNLYNRNKQVYGGLNTPKKKPDNPVVKRALGIVNFHPFSLRDVKTGLSTMFKRK